MSCKLSSKRKEQKERRSVTTYIDVVSCRRGALGFSIFAALAIFKIGFSVFRFWCSLRFADFPYLSIWFSVFAKNINGFSDLIFDAVFGFHI